MCLFSRAVEHVSATKIFARGLADGRQVLVYAMDVAASEDLAMILPLPVLVGAADGAVEFVDLSGYRDFFVDLKRAFPEAMLQFATKSLGRNWSNAPPRQLQVHQVGAFEASFVPSPRDFDRLDPRFRLDPAVLAALPYADWGFAVFQLRRGKRASVHPMAMRFPRREPDALFFPTVHVHDGTIPETAAFDHTLYAQLPPVFASLMSWDPSLAALATAIDTARANNLVDGAAGGWATMLFGALPNRDTWLRAPAGVTASDLTGGGATYSYRIQARYLFAPQALPQYPKWPATVRDGLAALCNGVRSELAELVQRNARAWQLGALHDALPPHFMNGPQLWRGTSYRDGSSTLVPGSGRVEFTPFSDLVEPQRITLGFTTVPTKEEAVEINRALATMLDRAIASGG